VERDADQLSAAAREAKERRNRQKSLDRSRRNTNPDQYQLSRAQKREQKRRKDAGLSDRRFVPAGPLKTRKDDEPVQAYRHDRLSRSYRKGRAGAAEESTGLVRTRRDRARPSLPTSSRPTGLIWWSRTATSPPGPASGDAACTRSRQGRCRPPSTAKRPRPPSSATPTAGCGGASTRTTALSQHCLCGHRAAKTLGQRTHRCPRCGLEGDRDAVSATLAGVRQRRPRQASHGDAGPYGCPTGTPAPDNVGHTRPDHPTHQGPPRRPVRAQPQTHPRTALVAVGLWDGHPPRRVLHGEPGHGAPPNPPRALGSREGGREREPEAPA
jgi:hypothetical protein